jgi:hypothetical protein
MIRSWISSLLSLIIGSLKPAFLILLATHWYPLLDLWMQLGERSRLILLLGYRRRWRMRGSGRPGRRQDWVLAHARWVAECSRLLTIESLGLLHLQAEIMIIKIKQITTTFETET